MIHCTHATGGVAVTRHTPRSGYCVMTGNPIPCLIQKRGHSLGITLAKAVRELLPWRAGDFVAVRVCGEKLVIERIPLEKTAIIRTGEAQPYAAGLFER